MCFKSNSIIFQSQGLGYKKFSAVFRNGNTTIAFYILFFEPLIISFRTPANATSHKKKRVQPTVAAAPSHLSYQYPVPVRNVAACKPQSVRA
jgi:hypothetical protein